MLDFYSVIVEYGESVWRCISGALSSPYQFLVCSSHVFLMSVGLVVKTVVPLFFISGVIFLAFPYSRSKTSLAFQVMVAAVIYWTSRFGLAPVRTFGFGSLALLIGIFAAPDRNCVFPKQGSLYLIRNNTVQIADEGILPPEKKTFYTKLERPQILSQIERDYPGYKPVLFAIEMFLPFVELHQVEYWEVRPHNNGDNGSASDACKGRLDPTIWKYYMIITGAFFSLLLALSPTRLLRRE